MRCNVIRSDVQCGTIADVHPFQLMAEPIRRRIIEILALGEHAYGDIAGAVCIEFGVTRRAVNWHLAILREGSWVRVRDDWPYRMYRLDDTALRRLRSEVRKLDRLWRMRYGTFEKRGPEAAGVEPQRQRRLAPGTAKGLRGRRKDDIWVQAERRLGA